MNLKRRFRGRRVTLLRLGVLTMGMINFWRAAVLWRQLSLVTPFSPAVDPRLRLGLALFWGVVWVWLAAVRWRGRSFVRLAIPGAFFLYTMAQIWLLLAATSAVLRAGWPLTAVLGSAAIIYSLWALRE